MLESCTCEWIVTKYVVVNHHILPDIRWLWLLWNSSAKPNLYDCVCVMCSERDDMVTLSSETMSCYHHHQHKINGTQNVFRTN